ncbi:MerR family DNA-binding transcriptional regulator [Amycolatopsis granulosa]|uniref:MerR family DNA-binding transcriptional regulator n=1 Tax=Amycolatopsis granulosa TaxID=185684 RepID=UPI001422818A|nr:DNA-binding transcriptional MerR regulator [Amycolatopsis granulosa]
MVTYKPAGLAREHGISAQAVRNYERDGFLPAAARTPSGYRIYTEVHAAALRAFLALVRAGGHAMAGQIMIAVNEGRLDHALTLVDRGHAQLLRDRETLDSVRRAIGDLTGAPATTEGPARTIGELARRLRVTPATLRKWEEAGIVAPTRDPATGYRRYHAADVRDAELAHLLRRGGYLLEHIAPVVRQVRAAGGTEALSGALAAWQAKLTAQGVAMLDAAAHLSGYLRVAPTGRP